VDEEEAIFVLGLEPRHTYKIEVDDEELYEAESDGGGILMIDLPRGKTTAFRISG
jgi:hypothetical protein